VNANTEKLQTALLNSISHDLRTPLATITGVFSSLHETEGSGSDQVKIDPADRLELIDTGWEEARRLNRLVGNLLDITRLEAGALRLNRRSADVQDVVGAALGRLADPQGHGLPRSRLAQHPLVTGDLSGLPPVNIDFVLIEQALVNLLENAAKYSPPGTPIEIEGSLEGSLVKITVLDLGSGFPSEDLEKVFEKFYRAQRNGSPGGTGLGLSICRGIVEAHGGRIWAENRPGGGAVVAFTLPVEENPV
jgi:two-component system sensor histidine kinase KdpD